MIANPNDGNSPRVEVATPIIDVSAGGLITATTEQEAGYVPGGTKSSTKQLPMQAAKTVTPGTTNQTAVASGRYTTGAVTVAGDANLKAENIAEGVSIFGVTGTHSGGGGNFTPPRYMAYSMYAFISDSGTLILNGAQIFAFFIAAAQLVAASNYAWVNEEPPTPSVEIEITASNMSRFNTAIRLIMAVAGNAASFNDLSSSTIGEIRETIKNTFARIGVSVSYSDNVVAVSIGSDTLTINF